MLKIGHRGAKGYVAENTLNSFAKAIELGVHTIELDVRLSQDNELVVIHDETVDRTTNSSGLVSNFTKLQLKNLEIPDLKSVFKLVANRCKINIEIKEKNAKTKVLQFVNDAVESTNWTYADIEISCFDWSVLEYISSQNNKIQLGVLTENNVEEALAFAKKINAYSINPYFKLVNEQIVKEIHAINFKVFPWTVNQQNDIETLKTIGVDGIISDFPDRIS
jgi:glycerophosphoryl diester phosphodiesterase